MSRRHKRSSPATPRHEYIGLAGTMRVYRCAYDGSLWGICYPDGVLVEVDQSSPEVRKLLDDRVKHNKHNKRT